MHLQYDTYGTDQQYYMVAVNCIHGKEEAWYVDLKMGAYHITFKIDSGANIIVMSHETYNKFYHMPTLSATSTSLISPDRNVEAEGEYVAKALYKDMTYNFKVIVIKGENGTNLLSWQIVIEMGLIAMIN